MPLSSERITRMRQLYAEGVPAARMLAEEVDQHSLYYWLDGGPRDRARGLSPIRRRSAQRRAAIRAGGRYGRR